MRRSIETDFWHSQDQPVAARGRDEGEANASVARGWLDQRPTWFQLTGVLQFQDHVDADAILHAGDRIEEFQLQDYVGGNAFLSEDLRDPHERRIADGLGDAVVDAAT